MQQMESSAERKDASRTWPWGLAVLKSPEKGMKRKMQIKYTVQHTSPIDSGT